MSTPPEYATYFETLDLAALARDFPVGDAFMRRYGGMSRDELRHGQNALFQRQLLRAWQIPFYQRLWGRAGLQAGDIRTLDDITKLPIFGKSEVMASIERCPPFGDHHGREIPVNGRILPMIFHSTSGTTGRPQPLLFSPRSREIHKLLLARAYMLQGLRGSDVVHSVYGHGPVNGGHYIREAMIHHTPAVFFPAGTGVETPSIKQVEFMRDFGATVIVGFADYIKRLADVAREHGLEPGRDIPVRMISGHLGKDTRAALAEAWGGAELFDWYGVGDTGLISTEGPDHDGMHFMEDAHFIEICDVDSGDVVPHGEMGDLVVSCLFTDDIFPIIRFNTHDVTRCLPGDNQLGLPFRRMEGFLGRSDNMVKLRGINVFPQAVGSILAGMNGFADEFVCILTREASGREELAVHVECSAQATSALAHDYAALLKRRLGVEVHVQLCAPRSLAPLTGVETRQKPIRLIDRRHA
ncbi:MAG: phenylacetate--CoA ligase family protein [Comamonadaceae bacterium]|nr:MAG: phenylacetate--CoA ligase family protein [Comamonadaceae bacterium]